jgi:hypothetical protein
MFVDMHTRRKSLIKARAKKRIVVATGEAVLGAPLDILSWIWAGK